VFHKYLCHLSPPGRTVTGQLRQSGKTTLARLLVSPDAENYFDLESPDSLRRLDDPETALAQLRGVVVIDEVQRRPELLPILRVLIDRPRSKLTFMLILGRPAINWRTGNRCAACRGRLAMAGDADTVRGGTLSGRSRPWKY
jgi:uncharacterized protein